MVNINIQIPDELHKKIKLIAVKEDKTIKEYIIEVLTKEAKGR
jgi:predicted HicB family RNase H-like nuclease